MEKDLLFKEFAEKYCTVGYTALFPRLRQGWTIEQIIERYVDKKYL